MNRVAVCALVVMAAGAVAPAGAQQSASRTTAHPIEAVHVTGHKRYTPAQVIAVSGVTPGGSMSVADLDAVITRMAATGLFSNVGYKYAPDATGTKLIVTFDIEEPEWKVPVLFDNFVWFSDAELTAAVAADVPSFDGTLPQTEGAHTLVVQSLQRFLKSKQIDRPVEFLTYSHVRTKAVKYLFKVTDPALTVCALDLVGASPAWQTRFAPAIAARKGQPYSRVSLEGLAISEIEDTYRTRGLLDAEVGAPTVRHNDGCDGVRVTLPVVEGPSYTWAGTTWSGNTVLPTADLDRLIAVKTGATADTAALDQGISAIRGAYGKLGHVQARVAVSTRADKAASRAHLDLHVNEGPQFRMGTLQFAGLTEQDAAQLAKRWQLKPGQIFDVSYIDRFHRSEIARLQAQRRLMARPNLSADLSAGVVNVRFEFRPADR